MPLPGLNDTDLLRLNRTPGLPLGSSLTLPTTQPTSQTSGSTTPLPFNSQYAGSLVNRQTTNPFDPMGTFRGSTTTAPTSGPTTPEAKVPGFGVPLPTASGLGALNPTGTTSPTAPLGTGSQVTGQPLPPIGVSSLKAGSIPSLGQTTFQNPYQKLPSTSAPATPGGNTASSSNPLPVSTRTADLPSTSTAVEPATPRVKAIPITPPELPNTSAEATKAGVDKGPVMTSGAPVGTTPPASQIQDSLAEFEKIARNWMTGADDSVFRIAANRVIDQLGLLNQAERDALQMQINQDPSLRGQGAGRAMLEIMARNQNFKAGDIFAQLAQESQERILNLQKYGFEKGLQINQEQRSRRQEAINTLIKAGNFTEAAKGLQQALEKDGFSGITITPESLKMRDEFSVSQFKSRMDSIKELALVDPNAALAMLRIEMDNPANKDWFPTGSTPEQFIESLIASGTPEALERSRAINEEVNRIAASTTSSYAEAAGLMKQLFREQRRDPIKEGRGLSIEDINKVRAADGLAPFSRDAMGNLIDEAGNLLTDEDFAELAYQKEWMDRKTTAQEKPWDDAYRIIMAHPDAEKFLNEENFPGGKDALKSYLYSYFVDAGAYSTDPETGLPVPKLTGSTLPWQNPKYYPLFYTWPKAVFDANGKTVGKVDMGGDVYGETFADGTKVTSTPEDEALDAAYAKYLRTTANPLSAPDWYFATAGGTTQPNASNVPKTPGMEDHTKVGAPGGTSGDLPSTPPTPGTIGGVNAAKDSVDEIVKTLPASSTATADSIKREVANLSASNYRDVDAYRALEKLNLPGFKSNASFSTSNVTSPWKVTPEGKIYFGFYNLMKSGMTEKQAAGLAIQAVGEAKFKAAYKALTGKDWGG